MLSSLSSFLYPALVLAPSPARLLTLPAPLPGSSALSSCPLPLISSLPTHILNPLPTLHLQSSCQLMCSSTLPGHSPSPLTISTTPPRSPYSLSFSLPTPSRSPSLLPLPLPLPPPSLSLYGPFARTCPLHLLAPPTRSSCQLPKATPSPQYSYPSTVSPTKSVENGKV